MRRLLILGGSLILSAHFAHGQTLDCKQISADAKSGAEHVEHYVELSDEDYQAGYRITGGGCEQTPAFGEHYTWVNMAVPTPRRFTCGLIGTSNQALRAKPYAIACRIAPAPLRRIAHFSSNGLGGGIVTIARIAGDAPNYTLQIPFSIRVCNLEGGTQIGVYFGAGSDNTATGYKPVPYRQCLEVDKPKELLFHTTETVSIDVGGKYEIFKPGTFKGATVIKKPTEVAPENFVKLSNDRTETAMCYQPTDPRAPPFPIPGAKLNPSYWGWCKPPSLAGGKNYRVCFDDGYSNQGPSQGDYPGAFIPMVLDPKLMTQCRFVSPQRPPTCIHTDRTVYISLCQGLRNTIRNLMTTRGSPVIQCVRWRLKEVRRRSADRAKFVTASCASACLWRSECKSLEFWATWCGPCRANMPHLSELQDKYPQAIFIGVTVMEPNTEALRTFVAELGDQIRYRIAIEEVPAGSARSEGGWMTKHWLEASYRRGIPAAFIVNHAGQIAWIGHPIELEEPLAAVINGNWDLSCKAQAHREMLVKTHVRQKFHLQQEINKARAANNGANVVAVIDTAIAADPILEKEFGAQKLDALMKDQASKSTALEYAAYLIEGLCRDDAVLKHASLQYQSLSVPVVKLRRLENGRRPIASCRATTATSPCLSRRDAPRARMSMPMASDGIDTLTGAPQKLDC